MYVTVHRPIETLASKCGAVRLCCLRRQSLPCLSPSERAHMSLSRNDMLSTEGRAPRARRSCYVNEPAYGFFIAGSTVKAMNGVYIRKNPPQRTAEEEEVRQDLLYYTHIDSPWTMLLAETPELSDANPYFHRSQGERSEWVFVDERGADRFTHKGDTIVPGAGVAWKHVHRTSGGARVPEASEARRDSWRSSLGFGGGRNTTQLAAAAEDDEDELPWQVIAVLDHDILRQLMGGYQYHKERCEEAVQGRGVVDPPALTSLEGCYLPGVCTSPGLPNLEARTNHSCLAGPGGRPAPLISGASANSFGALGPRSQRILHPSK